MMADHYFSKKPASELKLKKIDITVRGLSISFFTASGVFSAQGIDFGTKLLAKKMIIGKNDRILDLGCGIGFLGVIASKLTANKVTLADINERACEVARLNSKDISNVEVLQGDMFEPVKTERFDVILLNPPQTAGKEVCFKMIKESIQHLTKGGSLQIVARHNKGGETLSKKMLEVFGNVKDIAKGRGYRVYVSTKMA